MAIHGRGADENDLVPLVLSLERADVLLVSPRAPFPFPSGGFTWYDIIEEATPDPKAFGVSLKLLRKFIDEIKAGYPVDPDRLVLVGFSQGTVMAHATALLNPASYLAVAALSGYIPLRSGLSFDLGGLKDRPFFISHGTYDELIPVKFGREAAQFLMQGGSHKLQFTDETDALAWMTWDDLQQDLESSPGDYHSGLLKLLQQSGDQIREICEAASNR